MWLIRRSICSWSGTAFIISSMVWYMWMISWTMTNHGLMHIITEETSFTDETFSLGSTNDISLRDTETEIVVVEPFESTELSEDVTDEEGTVDDVFNSLGRFINTTSTLGVLQGLESIVLQHCDEYPVTETEDASDNWWVHVQSAKQYQCDMLALCEQEDAQFEDLQNDDYHDLGICPCLPTGLVGTVPLNQRNLQNTPWMDLLSNYTDILPGGHWRPRDCTPRRKVAVIIPYRDRQRHLRAFLAHTLPILQRQLLEFRIFVVEQNYPYLFNKASLMNIGYLEAKKLFLMDCILFHDVDTLIERDDNMVICDDKPVHFAAYADRHKYRFFPRLFGAATLLRRGTFEKANGFSNLYYGWGAEDDDFRNRLTDRHFKIYKGPAEIAKCTLIEHVRDTLFTQRFHRRTNAIFNHAIKVKSWYRLDGLNSLRYTVINKTDLPLYTWIQVDLKVPQIVSEVNENGIIYKASRGSRKLMLRNVVQAFKKKPANYTIERQGCAGNGRITKERQNVSRVTCRFMCQTMDTCKAVEYHPGNFITDDYCYLLNKTVECKETTTEIIELHTKRS